MAKPKGKGLAGRMALPVVCGETSRGGNSSETSEKKLTVRPPGTIVRHFYRCLTMRHCLACLLLSLLLGITMAANARDLPRSDPERMAILEAARDSPAIRFVVKDLYRSGDFAWLCALESVDGKIHRTDQLAIEYNAFALFRDQGRWQAERIWSDFQETTGIPDCSRAIDQIEGIDVPPASQEDLKAIWQSVVRQAALEDIRWGHRGDVFEQLRSKMPALRKLGVLDDFVIDTPKTMTGKGDLDAAMARCQDSRCRAVMKQATADLVRQQANKKVSALVWYNCQYGLRIQRTDLIASCVETNAPKPQCRSGLRYFQDKDDIQRCLDNIRQQCESLPFADEMARNAVCFMSN